MAADCRRIGELVTRIQEAYLRIPGLTLTRRQAERRFRIADPALCRAVFDLFLETGVLTVEDAAGAPAYRLRRPRLAAVRGHSEGDAESGRPEGSGHLLPAA